VSVLKKNWRILNNDRSKDVAERLFANRGLKSTKAVNDFLNTSIKKGFHNPFLMKNMEKAVERIKKAVEKEERIMIFGDYDVDGISGTAILVHTLKLLGAKVSYRLPHRVENGYGLSQMFIDDFVNVKVDLLITVDCGISSREQIEDAANRGIDVIITDHHKIPEGFPDRAYAVLHPLQIGCDYPFKGLTGAGVAYKLASALIKDILSGEERDDFLHGLLDLASLGTVADLGPLLDENRIIVKYGLQSLKNTKWVGLNYLMEYAGVDANSKLDASVIGFRLGPRINAAGRIANPYYSLQLLLYDKPDERGRVLAEQLDTLNKKRQQMVAEALEEMESHIDPEQERHKFFMAWSPNWHVGILGLLAGKFVERHQAPCIVLQDLGDYLVASGRSPEAFNMVEALTQHSQYLKNFGGHAQAAGFTIEKKNLEAFKESMIKYVDEQLNGHEIKQNLNIECELSEEEINDKTIQLLQQLEPFGIGNEQPKFLIRNLDVVDLKKVGKEARHLFFGVQGKLKRYPVIGFKLGEFEPYLQENPKIDLICHLEENEWNGTKKIQLRAIDFKAAE